MVALKIQVNSQLLHLATTVEKDVAKAVNEALHLWLKKKIITCPITNSFCTNVNGTCNECEVTKRSKKSHK